MDRMDNFDFKNSRDKKKFFKFVKGRLSRMTTYQLTEFIKVSNDLLRALDPAMIVNEWLILTKKSIFENYFLGLFCGF